MEETTLYRKYRPRKFSEVLGQDHITEVLSASIKENNISHAYLFSGPRGTGKTSVARILASELGTVSEDLYEIDGASNRGIDDARDLRDSVNVHPFESKYKIYIIDEVHMLTRESFNALLKTLEEPPKHVIFILATTELHKVPDTIISRCQTYEFKKPTDEILQKMVLNLAKKEGVSLDSSGANLISIMSEGSFRDAQGILQKVLTISHGKKIVVEDIEKITGAPNKENVLGFIKALIAGNLDDGLSVVEKARDKNIDMSVFLKMILRDVRYMLLISNSQKIKEHIKKEIGESEFEKLSNLSNKSDSDNLFNILNTLLGTYEKMRFAHIPEIPLELALVEIIGENSRRD